jgi:hypothetical protein
MAASNQQGKLSCHYLTLPAGALATRPTKMAHKYQPSSAAHPPWSIQTNKYRDDHACVYCHWIIFSPTQGHPQHPHHEHRLPVWVSFRTRLRSVNSPSSLSLVGCKSHRLSILSLWPVAPAQLLWSAQLAEMLGVCWLGWAWTGIHWFLCYSVRRANSCTSWSRAVFLNGFHVYEIRLAQCPCKRAVTWIVPSLCLRNAVWSLGCASLAACFSLFFFVFFKR